jgi:hypothetical protein
MSHGIQATWNSLEPPSESISLVTEGVVLPGNTYREDSFKGKDVAIVSLEPSCLNTHTHSPAKQGPVPNDDNPAITTSSFLLLFQVPMNATITSTELRIYDDSHQTSLNGVTTIHVFAMTATMTATMTQVLQQEVQQQKHHNFS